MRNAELHDPIGIRMQSVLLPNRMVSFEEATEALAVIRSREADYRCGDYLDRQRREAAAGVRVDGDPSSSSSGVFLIDSSCRERMCEWCYRVCDSGELPLTRDMVAVSFSFLDRFLDLQPVGCDRASFKLAVVTSFYIATKILSSKQVSISSLVALGRGTFSFYQVQEMEKVLLSALEWRLNPPTVQISLENFRSLFPKTISPGIIDAIYQRATFFAELVIYDHCFVSSSRYVLAVACLLNAMEFIEAKQELDGQEKQSLASFEAVLCMDLDSKRVHRTRMRLWKLYRRSAQASDETLVALHYSGSSFLQRQPINGDTANHPVSPRGVELLE